MMRDAILVINTGSSSIKFAVYAVVVSQATERYVAGQIKGIGAQALFSVTTATADAQTQPSQIAVSAANHAEALHYIFTWLASTGRDWHLLGVGHRVVHGGARFTQAVRVDGQILGELQTLIPLAPLHQPHALHAIEALLAQQPQLSQVACFDTAFHAKLPRHEQHFALPRKYEEAGVRRYGFHGLSYEYIASVLPDYLGEGADGKVVIAHLGHGVSMCALHQRCSMATTMSFTPLDGLPMGKRSGALDPAIVLYLLAGGMSAEDVSNLLHHQSGLLGMSGISDDMQTLLASTQTEASEAIAYFCYRVSRELGSLAAALGGLDALVFTGGIGEHAAPVRSQICERAAWLGVTIDEAANQANARCISLKASAVSVWVIPTDEEHMIAQHTLTTIRPN
jgi:acetate kinase